MNGRADHPQRRRRIEPARMALILIDVINDLDNPDITDAFVCEAVTTAHRILGLKRCAKRARVPVIYANDNFGQWRADFGGVIRHCRREAAPGRRLCEILLPEDDDYFVLKPRHSAFFETALQTLLRHLDRDTLILAGFAGDVCVLFTAHDAYMREYGLFVPRDCIASVDPQGNARALSLMSSILKADTRPSEAFGFPG